MKMFKILSALAFWLAAFAAQAQQQGNLSASILSATVRTVTAVSADQINPSWRGGHFIISASVVTAGSFTPKIQGKDPVSGNYYDILVGPAVSTVTDVVLKVYPGIAAVANSSASDILPRVWRLNMVGASSPNMKFSVGAFLEQ